MPNVYLTNDEIKGLNEALFKVIFEQGEWIDKTGKWYSDMASAKDKINASVRRDEEKKLVKSALKEAKKRALNK